MNEPPVSPSTVEPVPETRTVRVPFPAIPPTVTYVLIGFTVAVYLGQLLIGGPNSQIDWLEVFGARINSAIRAGELWRLITPVFLHGSPAHIFFNMYALLSIGIFLEKQYGHAKFTLLYFLGAFTGNVLSFFLSGDNNYSIGASTAVFALISAELVFFYQNRKLFGKLARSAMGNIIFIVVVNLFIGLAPGIDDWGHVGGMLGGAIFAWFAGPLWRVTGTSLGFKLENDRSFRDTIIGTGLTVIVFGAIAIWGMFR